MVIPCSRSAARPSTNKAKSIFCPCVPIRLLSAVKRGELILEDHLAVVKKPPDQGRFAVVHRTAGDESQQRFVLMLAQVSFDVLRNQVMRLVEDCAGHAGHQKYPACFFSFHRGALIVVDRAALPLRGGGQEHFLNYLGHGCGGALDRSGQRVAAECAKANRSRTGVSPERRRKRSSSTMSSRPSRSTVGRGAAKYRGTIGMLSR